MRAERELQGLALNRVSYTTLVEAYAEAGQLSTAESWAAAAAAPNVAPAGASGDWLHTVLVKARAQVHPVPHLTTALSSPQSSQSYACVCNHVACVWLFVDICSTCTSIGVVTLIAAGPCLPRNSLC